MSTLVATFANVFAYLFDGEWNEEYANAPHIRIRPDTNVRYPNNILIMAIDDNDEIIAMCSYDGEIALEQMEVEYEETEDCPNCADQKSIAAPGQTILCKTHSDEKHYADMKDFFIENLQTLQINAYLPFCSACGSDRPNYIGMIPNASGKLVSFAFCVNCRDEMTLKQNAICASKERIGA